MGPKRILKNIGIFILGFALLYYVSKQLVNLVDSSLVTETAFEVAVQENIEAYGYIMRDESVLVSSKSGIMLSSIPDGARISKDKEVVKVYSRENDYSAESKIRAYEERISVLEKSTIDTSIVSTDITKMDERIGEMLSSTVVHISDNDIASAISNKNEILVEMNKRWLLSNPEATFKETVNSLKGEIISLKSSFSGAAQVIYAPESGYYYSDTDGYENIFSASKIEGLSLDEFSAMCESLPEHYSENVAGKIVTDYVWYIACPVSRSQSAYFDVGKTYDIEFVYNYGNILSMKLEQKLLEDKKEEALLIFSSGEISPDFDFSRKQKVKIVYNEHRGLKVPERAVRILDDKKGVYVIKGMTVEFCLIDEVYRVDDYYIVEKDKSKYPTLQKRIDYITTTDDNGNDIISEKTIYYSPISEYDLVVVGGKVYDGMNIQ